MPPLTVHLEPDADTCYRAVASRDARFDGRFFTGVRTTGIYCRPVCPAVTPLRRNVVFFACAAAAEQAGFRPCRRCRPEAAPGSPAWQGTAATVSRAVRCIAEGALDRGPGGGGDSATGSSVADLAARLGVGPRQLTRLCERHLGTTPVRLAQTRRVHFARLLIEQSDLSMAQVALASGFGSLRRFNALMKATYGCAPGDLRRRRPQARGSRSLAPPTCAIPAATPPLVTLTCRLVWRPPYDWDQLARFLRGRAITGVEHATVDSYTRTLALPDGRAGFLAVAPGRGHWLDLHLELPDLDGAITLVARARRMFDCAADPAAINEHLARDPVLAPLVARRPGLRLPSAFDPFELAVRAIIGQQVSVAAATTVTGRVVTRCGTPLESPRGPLTHLFPAPAVLAAADLDGLGLTTRRVATLRTFAAAVAGDSLRLDAPRGPDELAARLQALPGLGPWTAAYIALRALGEPDALPVGDLGLARALPGVDLTTRGAAWSPWRGYAALHLWAGLEDGGTPADDRKD
ncbi:MAG: DNA-3-methyladenine glycosylase 2 family protein [bacterium]|nr:DNA-3-methyladenine glycosylase 2 family protein [bacterium]